MTTTLVADIESDGLLQTITQIHQISVIDLESPGVTESYNDHSTLAYGTLADGLKRLQVADIIIGHNFIGYDGPAIKIVTGIDLDWRTMIDTLVLSRLGNPSRPGGHSLEAWAGRFPDLDVKKIENEDWTKWSPTVELRCNEDVKLNLAVYERLKPMLELMPVA